MKTFPVNVNYCGITSTYWIEAETGEQAVRQVREAFGPDHPAFVVLGF